MSPETETRPSRWGTPIDVAKFAQEHGTHNHDDIKAAVKKLTEEIEQRMVGLTINAPDWSGHLFVDLLSLIVLKAYTVYRKDSKRHAMERYA